MDRLRQTTAACGHLFLVLVLALLASPAFGDTGSFTVEDLPALPTENDAAALGTHGKTLVLIDREGSLYTLADGENAAWQAAGTINGQLADAIAVSTPSGVVVLRGGSTSVLLLSVEAEAGLKQRELPPLPTAPPARPLVNAIGDTLYLLSLRAGGSGHTVYTLDLKADTPNQQWNEHSELAAPPLSDSALFVFGDRLYVFGTDPKGEPHGYRFSTGGPAWDRDWKDTTPPPAWSDHMSAVAFGEAHLFVVVGESGEAKDNRGLRNRIFAYHTITDRWVEYALPAELRTGAPLTAVRDGRPVMVAGNAVVAMSPEGAPPRFRVLDKAVVVAYLLGMVGIGVWFSRREKSTADFFRGGGRVPWWASGMSLFATFSSAISLMTMPRKGYETDWTYFAIGVGELLALPIALFFLVPLIRRLKISTSNEYLEMRFGVVTRVIGSVIFILIQIGGRLAPVMLLPSIALEAITGIHAIYFILVMGVVTTVYTYLGGLEAVVWTDTIQGFVMVGTIAACLALVFFQLDTPTDQIVPALMSEQKLHTFERHWSLVEPTLWVFIVYSFTTIVMRLADQNFVQRVQCTPTLRQAKSAVVTQLAVAIPLNLLLFMVGTAMWLFYRDKPELIDPTIKTDSIYPFFVAQQMPIGVAGLVVAALLAATMSTVSSSICSVSDLCVSDFYKRFSRNATDHKSLVLGRTLTAVVGVFGTATAIALLQMDTADVWDVSVMIINLIGLGIAGLFLAGLLTKRVHEVGVITGFVAAVIVITLFKQKVISIDGKPITFFLDTFIGSVVTFVVGYGVSVIIPAPRKPLAGLTVYTVDDAREDVGHAPVAEANPD